jgi:hypothetical protein
VLSKDITKVPEDQIPSATVSHDRWEDRMRETVCAARCGNEQQPGSYPLTVSFSKFVAGPHPRDLPTLASLAPLAWFGQVERETTLSEACARPATDGRL